MPDSTRPTKSRLQHAALSLFVTKGVEATTTREIAAAAGVAEGTLYRHYDSKDALVWELFSVPFSEFACTLDDIQRRHADLEAKLDAMINGFCTLFDQDWVLFSFLLLVQHQQLDKVTAEMANPVKVVRTVLAEAMERGELPPGHADLAAALVIGPVLQAATFTIYGRLERPLAQHAATLSAACRRALGG